MNYILSYDLGTGGIKASLYDGTLQSRAKTFLEYPTYFPEKEFREQRPQDWWDAFCLATKQLVACTGVNVEEIEGLALSGASLVCIPFDAHGNPLSECVPIWSDKRADREAEEFFGRIPQEHWYCVTGNGFPAPSYPLFKLMWLKKHRPELYRKTAFVLGSKDYINYRLTGQIATDPSYASGSGAYHLTEKRYEDSFFQAAEIPKSLFADPRPSHECLGKILPQVAKELGLSAHTSVFVGGVDNACTALGIIGDAPNRSYVSLGTSVWIPVNCTAPILDPLTKPYTFAHIGDGMYTSAYSIFSGGNSLRWLKQTLFPNAQGYAELDECAVRAPVGSNGVLFHPGLAGGTSQDKSVYLRGGFFGLTLSTTKEDMIRAVYEGIAFDLHASLQLLSQKCSVRAPIAFCGGGSKSDFWLSVFADVFGIETVRTNVDQGAATLGAAAIAARGLGYFDDYRFLEKLRRTVFRATPNRDNTTRYRKLLPLFRTVCDFAADYGQRIHDISKEIL